MRLSLNWINDYVDISDIDPEFLAHKLTMTTAEVEDITPVRRRLKNIVAGEIVSVKTVIAGRGISEIMVNCGNREIRTITTTKELKPGMKTAFANLGSVLNGKQYVQLKEVAGVESRGKLCTPNDLCLGEVDDDVLHLPHQIKNGTCLKDLIAETDTLLNIDNHSLTHRPDLWGHYGFAREISAILQRPLKPLELWEPTELGKSDSVPVEIRVASGCQVYNCIRLGNLSVSPSSLVIQSRLNTLGQRSVNSIVDLTNYVMLETGQPLHAFDGDRVLAVTVDELNKKQQFVTLDGTRRKLQKNDLVILDQENRPVAIAGLMGGYDSQMTPKTTTVLLESANFSGSTIRKTANRLNLATEASRRFEKQQPPIMSITALTRMVYLLLKEHPTVSIKSHLTTKGNPQGETRSLEIPLDFFSRRMGTAIDAETITHNLNAIGFEVTRKNQLLQVGIPPFRSQADISIPEDILEEAARLHGYDNIIPIMPASPMEESSRDPQLELERSVRQILSLDNRFQEIQSYNWFHDDILSKINHETKDCIRLINPVSPKNTRLRDSIVPNLLSVMKHNADHCNQHNLFEIGRIFSHGQESRSVAVISYTQRSKHDPERFFLLLKGVMESIFIALDMSAPECIQDSEVGQEWRRDHLRLFAGEKLLGRMGLVPENICSDLMKDHLIAWFELDLDMMNELPRGQKLYKPIPKYPGSWFDFSVLFPDDVLFQEVEARLDKYKSSLLRKRTYLYKYKGDKIRKNMTSYTYRYELAVIDRTLSSEDLENFHIDLVDYFNKEGIQVR
ncbi:phenylalanine--tRNA ligase subunit beta [bacterium]|nr:phenylalanine--tRNA ligase subunit beta [bacterium]